MAKIATAEREIALPDGVTGSVAGATITMKGPKGEQTRDLKHVGVSIRMEGNTIIVFAEFPRRKEKALVGTFAAHIANMAKGVSEGFEYKLKTVYNHFPIKAKVDGNSLLIENFLGERQARRAPIMPDTKVQVKGEEVTVSGPNKEHVGQTASNIERATKVTKRDVRVFQDGIYVVSRGA